MTQIYTIPNGHLFYICGDLNSRCADFSDFIEGVDELPERHVVDFHHNSYGTIFCDFLIDVNCCILNGRNSLHNDYTFISTRGCSVVDYCIAPYEQLERFTDFYVHRATELVRQTGVADNFDLRTIVPDHSFLTWNVNLKFAFSDEGISRIYEPKRKIKYDTQNIPQDWLLDHDIIEKIDNIIRRLENGENTQVSVDSLYENFVNIIKSEMSQKLSSKFIICSGYDNKQRKCRKPWWNDELTRLWNDVCKHENEWIKAQGNIRKHLHHSYTQKRKIFDKSVQKVKRQYWYSSQEELLDSTNNPKEFWRKIGKIGVGTERQNVIPM